MGERDGERPKRPWRDIDARRDRSGSGTSQRSGGDGTRATSDHASKQYRAALEALFDKGQVGKIAEKLGAPAPAGSPSPATPPPSPGPPRATAPTPAADSGRATLRKKVLEAIGRDAVTRAVEKYLKEYPLPEDWEFLEQVLEHRDDDRVRETLALLGSMLGRDKPKRSRVMAAKLRMIEETSDDKSLREEAAKVRARLG